MDTLIEAIPTWALCYLFNSDATGLTDEEIALIDQWYTENKVMGITTATEQEGECFPYFSLSGFRTSCRSGGLPRNGRLIAESIRIIKSFTLKHRNI